jgi:hypothetical protein
MKKGAPYEKKKLRSKLIMVAIVIGSMLPSTVALGHSGNMGYCGHGTYSSGGWVTWYQYAYGSGSQHTHHYHHYYDGYYVHAVNYSCTHPI